MTYGEAKERVLKLLDEEKPKYDLLGKLPVFFDMAQKEVALFYPIRKEKTYEKGEKPLFPSDLWKARFIKTKNGIFPYDKWAALPDAFTLIYDARPGTIPAGVQDSYVFEIADEAMPAIIYYCAAQTESKEYDQRYFTSFYAQYQGEMQNLAALDTSLIATVVDEYVDI